MKRLRALVAILSWIALGYGLSRTTPAQWVQLLQSGWGPLLYVVLYGLRPLAFLSAGLLSALGGSLFGAFYGYLLVTLGCNLSAWVAYGIGRLLGDGILPQSLVERYAGWMRKDPFGTMIFLRAIIILPYDVVNYLAALARLPLGSFVLGTFIGNLPGTLMFTLIGASLPMEDVLQGKFQVQIAPLVGAGALFLLILGLSKWLRRKKKPPAEHETRPSG